MSKRTVWVDASTIGNESFGAYVESDLMQGWFEISKNKDSNEAEGAAVFYYLKRALKRKDLHPNSIHAIYVDNQSVVSFIKENIERTRFFIGLKDEKDKMGIKQLISKLQWKNREGNLAHLLLKKKDYTKKMKKSSVKFSFKALTDQEIQEVIERRKIIREKNTKRKIELEKIEKEEKIKLQGEINKLKKDLKISTDFNLKYSLKVQKKNLFFLKKLTDNGFFPMALEKEFILNHMNFKMEKNMLLSEMRSYFNVNSKEINQDELSNFYKKFALYSIDEIDSFKILKNNERSFAYIVNENNFIVKKFNYSFKTKKESYENSLKKYLKRITKQSQKL